MGYCMNQRNSSFFMDVKDFPAALKAVQALHGDETINDGGGRHFSWVDHDFHKQKSLPAILNCWRWHLDLDESMNATDINFGGEKLGDDIVVLQAIAPFVKKGSFIEMHGEDGCLWRWIFDGRDCNEKTGKVSFE